MQPVKKESYSLDLIAAAEAARILGVSGEWVRQLAAVGKLSAITIQPTGFRVFHRADVERLRAEREGSAEAKQ